MEIDLYKILSENFILMVFVVIGLGYVIGRMKVFGIEFGPTIGVLLAGLLFGHFGFKTHPNLGTFGFTVFIFAVGFQAGPSFFAVFFTDGLKYLTLSFIIASIAVGLTLLLAHIFHFETGLNAGLLAGALTSTPTLAGAQDAVTSGLARLPEGMSTAQATENISVAYAITYIFGTAGLIVFIKFFPKMFGINLVEEARKISTKGERGRRKSEDLSKMLPIIRAYKVIQKELTQKALGVIRKENGEKGFLLKIKRGSGLLDPAPDMKLHMNDVISVIGLMSDIREKDDYLGAEVLDADLLNYNVVQEEIIVTQSHVTGRQLGEFNFGGNYGCFVNGLQRASIELSVNDHTTLNKGDRLIIRGEESQLKKLADELGYIEREAEKTDLLTFSLGISAGVLLGLIFVKIGNLSIGLGSAGGLLTAGILIGFLRAMHPTFGGLPNAALLLLKDFGLMIFMAGVGVKAGAGIVGAIFSIGPVMILCGIIITILPVIAGYFFGWKILKMNPAILLGSIAGAMTSTPSLGIVNDAAKSDVPALGYAGTYTFANVILTFAGTFIMTL
jgi:putative transport protein